jgi:hypothetical protein
VLLRGGGTRFGLGADGAGAVTESQREPLRQTLVQKEKSRYNGPMSEGIHIESDDPDAAPIPDAEVDARDVDDIGEAEALPEEDVEAEEDLDLEEDGDAVPDGAQPESQGEDPYVAELGEDGQGELAPEDL